MGGSFVLTPDGTRTNAPPLGGTHRQCNGQGDRAGVPLAGKDRARHYATIAEIAAAEKINESYVGRVLRLTLLAPEIVEMILIGKQSAELSLAALMRACPELWAEQRAALYSDADHRGVLRLGLGYGPRAALAPNSPKTRRIRNMTRKM